MKLYEFEGKALFAKGGIPVPDGEVVATRAAAMAAAERIGFPVAVKSQVLTGGRGKAGGIRFADDARTLEKAYADLSQAMIGGEAVSQVLIEAKLDVEKELYAGVTVDPKTAKPVLMLSSQGGVDIEQVAAADPGRIVNRPIDPLVLPRPYHLIPMVKTVGIKGRTTVRVAHLLTALIGCYFRFEAITAEINPLVIDTADRLFAADAKVEIDDAALFRHPAIAALKRSEGAENQLEREAREAGVSYVRLEESGFIGIISGGAGLGMATMDAVYAHGGVPANFLDLGHATPEKTAAALRVVLKTPGVRGVFLNAYGGINNCQEMAKGVIAVLDAQNPHQTIVVKMRGHSQEQGWGLLASRNIPVVKAGTTGEGVALLRRELTKRGEWPDVDPG